MRLIQETEAWKTEGSLRKIIPEKGNLLSRGKMGTHTSNGQTSGMGMLREIGGRKTRQSMIDCFRERREGRRQKCSGWAGNVVNRNKRRELGGTEQSQPAFPPQRDKKGQRDWGTLASTLP